MTDEQYVASGRSKCPNCKSTDITSGPLRSLGVKTVTASVECHNCKAEWLDVYRLVGYSDVKVPA